MILDHIGIVVSNGQKSKEFYTQALEPLGITLIMEYKTWCGFGKNNNPKFWFGPAYENMCD